jgi:4-hydroxybenzoate polyprenyltransferase
MKLRTALRLGRVSNLPTTWTDVVAGALLSGRALSPGLAAGLCAAVSALYVGGMYLNDAFDREYDARERPERPIPRGEASASSVFAVGFALLVLGVLLVAGLALLRAGGTGAPPVLAALALALLIVLYDAYHKHNPLSPALMALNRVLVYVTAALSVRAAVSPLLLWGCAVLFGYLTGLSYAAKQENLREPRGLWPLLVMAAPFAFAPALATGAGALAYAALAGWTAYSLHPLLDRRRRDVKRAVSQLIAGISLLDAMLVASQGRPALALLCALGLLATLLAQRFVPGT